MTGMAENTPELKYIDILTVNQRVLGSSPRGGAKLNKPLEIVAFFMKNTRRRTCLPIGRVIRIAIGRPKRRRNL